MQAIQLGIYILLLGSLALGVLVRPALAITAVACVFGLKQWGQFTVPWLAQNATFTNIAIGCIVLAAIGVQTVRGECVPCRLKRINWVVIALFAYAALSLFWTRRPDLAYKMVWERNYAYVLTFIVLAPLVIKDLQGLRTALIALALVGGVLMVVLLAYGEWGARGLLLQQGSHQRETNPLALAGLAGSCATAAMFVSTRNWKWLGWPVRATIIILSLIVIVRSGSRGQLVAALLTLLVMMPVAFRMTRARGMAAAFIGLVLVGGAMAYAINETMHLNAMRWDEALAARDAVGRWNMASKLLSVWADSGAGILIGIGNSSAYDPKILGIYPHIVPLEILAEEGFIGAALYVTVLWMCFSALLRAWRMCRNNPDERGLLAAVGGTFLFMLLLSCKEGSMLGSLYFFMYAILLGRMPELVRAAEKRRASKKPVQSTALSREAAAIA